MVVDEKTRKLASKALLNKPTKTAQAIFTLGVAVGSAGAEVELSDEEMEQLTLFLGDAVLAGKIKLAQ